MRRKPLLIGLCLLALPVLAQESPVLMRVNERDVSREEFESAFRRQAAHTQAPLSPEEFAPLFALSLQKVEEARAAGLDTTSAFRTHQQDTRCRLAAACLIAEAAKESSASSLPRPEQQRRHRGKVQYMQVFFYLPQTAPARQLEAYRHRMDSIYRTMREHPETDFSYWVERCSDDKQSHWIESGQTTVELEEAVFALSKGEISAPFLSPEGIHLLMVTDCRERATDEEQAALQAERVRRNMTLHKEELALQVERLKHDWQFVAEQPATDELLSTGLPEQPLFSIDGRRYTVGMFRRFAASRPQSVKRQLEDFIAKSLFDYDVQHLERRQPEMGRALQRSDEEYLIKELTRTKVELPAMNDRAGLSVYFHLHSSDYAWTTPRYKGIVLHCVDAPTARKAKKILKKRPEKEWEPRLRQAFGTSWAEKVQIEQGVFACGDNPYVDKWAFKKGLPAPVPSHPFTVVAGKKQKGPEEYQEVIDRLRKDYRTYLETCWERELKASGKVEINQEVLKTVNNY